MTQRYPRASGWIVRVFNFSLLCERSSASTLSPQLANICDARKVSLPNKASVFNLFFFFFFRHRRADRLLTFAEENLSHVQRLRSCFYFADL